MCHWNAIHLNSWLSLYPSFIYVQVFEFVYELVAKFWIKCNQQFAPVHGPACRPLCRLGRCAARQTGCPTSSSGLQPGAAGWCAGSSSLFVPTSSQHLYTCDTFWPPPILLICLFLGAMFAQTSSTFIKEIFIILVGMPVRCHGITNIYIPVKQLS